MREREVLKKVREHDLEDVHIVQPIISVQGYEVW